MIYLFLSNGFEETEALVTLDMLRRCDIDVLTVGIGSNSITGAHNITVKTDIVDNDVILDSNLSGVILPGGMPGTKNLNESQIVKNTVKYCYENGLLCAAICAAPIVFGTVGILNGKKATCYPGFESKLYADEVGGLVVRDQNIITAKGPGVSFQFAFEIVSYLKGNEAVAKLIGDTQWQVLMI